LTLLARNIKIRGKLPRNLAGRLFGCAGGTCGALRRVGPRGEPFAVRLRNDSSLRLSGRFLDRREMVDREGA
jgi:hypothetical protein